MSQGSWSVVAFPDVIEVFTKAAGLEMRHVGVNDEEELDDAMAEVGARARELATITDVRRGPLRQMVDSLREGLYSFTWRADEAARHAAAGVAEGYAEERYGSLDEERDIPTEMRWRAYDLPGAY
ncbi:MAG: hypothetical protein ABR613_12655 [Actinomycetota bacterium]